MEPIPLRTLTTLLNYERMISDPRFHGHKLWRSSLKDGGLVNRTKVSAASMLKNLPATVKKSSAHLFLKDEEAATFEPPSTTCCLHPLADPAMRELTFTELENIFHETHGHSECYKAIGLYHYFLDLCPSGQEISIQIAKEEPVLFNASTNPRMIEFDLIGPKQLKMAHIQSTQLFMSTGNRDGQQHSILGFKVGDSNDDWVVVDMTRMQYGEAGRGTYGEPYFLGRIKNYSLGEFYEKAVLQPQAEFVDTPMQNANEKRLKACSKKVFERWQNRENEHWCSYCGKPGDTFMKCGQCKTKTVWYCCKEHQAADWKLHKLTCEKIKTMA
ncbi:hypothetical protein BDZ45DRAFT_801176 [Acephala macrosclerotiorum]|nr:hypothetical protein BDZ45DRAFT_801176 [Acephala macrosclerotiorum]